MLSASTPLFLRQSPEPAAIDPTLAADGARIVRRQCHRDMLASIAEWQRASGPDRAYWRRNAQHDLRRFRRHYLEPERAAFVAAVAANRRNP